MFGSELQKELFGALGNENSIKNPSELLAGQAASDTAAAKSTLDDLETLLITWPGADPDEVQELIGQIETINSGLDESMSSVDALNAHTGEMSGEIHSTMAIADSASKIMAAAGEGDTGECVAFLEAMGSLAGGAEDLLNGNLSALGNVLGGLDGITDLNSLEEIAAALGAVDSAIGPLLSIAVEITGLVNSENSTFSIMGDVLRRFGLSSQLLSWKDDACTSAVLDNVASDEIKDLIS